MRAWQGAALLRSSTTMPSIATSKAVNKTYTVNNSLTDDVGAWLHISKIGGPQHLNDPDVAKSMAENGEVGEDRSKVVCTSTD